MNARHAMMRRGLGERRGHEQTDREAWAGMTGGHHRGRGRSGPFEFGHGRRGGFFFGPFGGGPPFRRGPKVGRGDVRDAVLLLLAEQPRNGYQIIQELAERSGGVWRPSPGSVYPALQQLEDEGLIRAEESDGRRAFRLTEEGTAYVQARGDDLAAPWDAVTETLDDGLLELRDLVGQVASAVGQVAQAGSDAQVALAQQVLTDTRRTLYRILADDEATTTS